MDTEEEIKSSPMAVVNGFFSGLANATILRNEDAFCGVEKEPEGMSRPNILFEGVFSSPLTGSLEPGDVAYVRN